MRIRSTKPEFWRSKTIAALPWDVRLVLKGLESYVDDNGVGKDDIALIAADVFPRDLSASPRETLASLSEAISHLSRDGLIARYEIDDERLLYIDKWKDLQRIDKPGKGRFPRPDGTTEYSETVNRETYRNIRDTLARPPETVAPVTGEQRNRGTEEQRSSSPSFVRNSPARNPGAKTGAAIAHLNSTARTGPANEIATAFQNWAGQKIDNQSFIEIAQEVDKLLDSEIEPHRIAEGMKAWQRSDSWSPTQIRRFVLKAAQPADDGIGTPTRKATSHLTVAEQIIAEMSAS